MLYALAEIRTEMKAGNMSAANDTTYNFFSQNECHPSDHEDEEVEQSYEQLHSIIARVPR